MSQVPVLLIHGWKSHPGVWNRLVDALSMPSDLVWSFTYTHLHSDPIPAIARELQQFIRKKRDELGYEGEIDIVCHSMGGYVARYYAEVLDGRERKEKVRQLIGIGVPNRGSSMAEIFNDPVHGPDVIQVLSGVFVPNRYIPSQDINVQGLRIRSPDTATLCQAGLRSDISYRNILAANRTGDPEFFPYFEGKTWVLCPDQSWKMTWLGDGVIPHADSYLPGTGFDLVPCDPGSLQAAPLYYCHIHLPGNPEVIRLIKKYLGNPEIPSSEFCPL